MLHLLKEKSKIQWSAKKRKTYEPLKPGLKIQQPASAPGSQIESASQIFKQNIGKLAKNEAEKVRKKTESEMRD